MLTLLVWILILGVLAFVVRSLPIDAPFKTAAYAVLVIILIILVANAFGVGPRLNLR